mmetsp:Transcript_30161/g.89488  ORF Transcript_30161/g.89488 Transcript_30161/m.89488 type:complete len:82 (-) Transcript_30161:76-321(-)|eukprot:153664-Chlamydomonas_euryale.AAC.6
MVRISNIISPRSSPTMPRSSPPTTEMLTFDYLQHSLFGTENMKACDKWQLWRQVYNSQAVSSCSRAACSCLQPQTCFNGGF